MKHKILFMAISVALLCACNDVNSPTMGNSDTDNEPVVSFNYQIIDKPFEVKFTNTSSGLSEFHWDFGDGRSADIKDVRHIYNNIGEYTVTLSGYTSSGRTYTCIKKIVLPKPKVHISGYMLFGIPYDNKYYRIAVYNEEDYGSGWGFESIYTPKLSSNDLPYTYSFITDIVMDQLDIDSYYYVYVFHSKNTSPNDDPVQCMKQMLTVSEIQQYQRQYLLYSNNGETMMYLYMRYD